MKSLIPLKLKGPNLSHSINCLHLSRIIIFSLLLWPYYLLAQPNEEQKAEIRRLRDHFNQMMMQNPDSALKSAYSFLDLVTELNDSLYLSEAFDKVGIAQSELANFQDALVALLTSLEIRQKRGVPKEVMTSHINLGHLYFQLGDYESCLQHTKSHLKMARSTGDSSAVDQALLNAGAIYGSMAKYERSIRLFRKCLQMRSLVGDSMDRFIIYENMASNHFHLGHNDSASYYLSQILPWHEREGNDRILASLYVLKANLLIEEGAIDSGETTLQKAITLGKETHAWISVQRAYSAFSKHKKEQGDYKMALSLMNKRLAIKDSLDLKDQEVLTQKAKAAYEMQQKQEEIARLKREAEMDHLRLQQKLNLMALGIIVLLLVFVFILVLIRQMGLVKNLRLQNQLLSAQINPHFMGNALIAVQDMILDGQKTASVSYIAKLANLMRNYLGASHYPVTTLEKELDGINDYLELQKLRFGEQLQYSIEVGVALKPSQLYLPSMLVQPLVENAVEHNTLNEKGLMIDIKLTALDNGYLMRIEDNGPGIMGMDEDKETVGGLSLKLIRHHIKACNKLYKSRIALKISNIPLEGGTIVEIALQDLENLPYGQSSYH